MKIMINNNRVASTTMKRVARNVADAISIPYREAKLLVSELVTDLRIQRLHYNTNIRSWEISSQEARMLVEHIKESRSV